MNHFHRKAYWRYCLQLWDDKIDNAISLSSLFEEKLSLVIYTSISTSCFSHYKYVFHTTENR